MPDLVSMEEPNPDARLEDKAETSTDEAGNEKHERSRGVDNGGKEDQIEIATDEARNEEGEGVDYQIEIVTDEAIYEVDGNNDEEGGKGTEVVNPDNVMMATEVDGDDDLEESDPSLDTSVSHYDDEHNLPHQGSEDDEAYENMVEGEEDVREDDEPVEEDFNDEDISEEEASEESDAGNDAQGEANIIERVGEEGSGQDPKEVKLKLKDSNKSSKMSKGQADKSMKVKSVDNPDPSGDRKGKAKVKSMGMIFFCNSKTKNDCFNYRVFGLPEGKKDVVEKIYRGMRLFLYNVDLKLMYGIYKAAGPGGYNIEPKAFKSQFPSQVRYTVLDDCLPLAEEKFKKVIKKNYYSRNKFDCKLNSLQVKQLCKLFIESSKGRTKPGRGPKAAKPRPSTQDRIRRERRPISKRRPDQRDEPYRHERPRKRARSILSPRSPPPTVPYADSYRQNIYPERDRTHRDDRDPQRLGRAHHYRDDRVPLLDDREPLLISRDSSYRVAREPYLDSYRGGARDSYLEPHDHPYKARRDPYTERLDPYREGRVASSYPGISRLDPCVDPYGTLYERDAYRDSGRVEYRSIYGGGEPFDRLASRPLSMASSSRPRLEIGQPLVSPGERPLYSESLYSLSRAPLSRDYHLL